MYARVTHQWNKDQTQDDCSTNQEPSTEHNREHIQEVFECVGRHYYHCQHNATDIDGSSNKYGVIQSFHFHFADGE